MFFVSTTFRSGIISEIDICHIARRLFGNKVSSVEDAVSLVRSHNTISVSGFVAQGAPETLLRELGNRFRKSGNPSNLKLVFGGGPGDYDYRGLNHLAQPGLLEQVVGSHYGQVPMIASMVLNNEIEGYCLPLGSISRMLRAAASASPGFLSKIGIGTFIDPIQQGGRLNAKSTQSLVERVELFGDEYLCYKAFPINVAIIRATTGDTAGNLSFEKESLYTDARVIAMAARSSGGIVLAQVERIAELSSLPMRSIHIPGALVDCLVLSERPEDSHQSFFTQYNPSWSGEIKEATFKAADRCSTDGPDARTVIARRAALELLPNQIVNLGIGMPEGVAQVAKDENFFQFLTLTTEGGVFGGVGASGRDFGPASGADALVEMNQQFDFYDGGGLDICFLGLAQCSENGDVNVSRLSETSLTGPGGFIDITQSTPRLIFMGTFRKKEFQMKIQQETENDEPNVVILKEGKISTFQKRVREITFSSERALQRGQDVLFITERAVFKLTKRGIELIEIAPGIDIEKDICQQMDFRPAINPASIKIMDSRVFKNVKMGLLDEFFSAKKAVERGVEFNKEANTVYLDFTGVTVNDREALQNLTQELRHAFDKISEKGTKRFHCVANYDGLSLADALVSDWEAAENEIGSIYYDSITRYSGRAFIRHKLAKRINVKDIDEMWIAFSQCSSPNDSGVLDRRHLREALHTLHHIKANENLLISLMQGDEVVTKQQFPGLLKRIRDYEMKGFT